MPKLKPEVQTARRAHPRRVPSSCAAAGFHRTTMHDICREAGVSPGALYVYFDSKEALIAGICERDRAGVCRAFRSGSPPRPTSCRRCGELGEQYFLEDPAKDHRMCLEIGLESTRNPTRSARSTRDRPLHRRKLRDAVPENARRGPHRARARHPDRGEGVHGGGDGMFWRRAVDPGFDPTAVMPAVLQLMRALLNPVPAGACSNARQQQPAHAVRVDHAKDL